MKENEAKQRPQPRRDPAGFEHPPNLTEGSYLTATVPSVEHPGELIPTLIVAQMSQFKRFTLTADDLLSMRVGDGGIEILSAPGEGMMYVVDKVIFNFVAGDIPYSYSGQRPEARLFYGAPPNGTEWLLQRSLFIEGWERNDPIWAMLYGRNGYSSTPVNENLVIVKAPGWAGSTANIVYTQTEYVDNQPVVFGVWNGGYLTEGNGTVTIILEYEVIQL